MKIKHLSVVVKNPERAAKVVAELSHGRAEQFISKNMHGAWVCKWVGDTDELIEFLPESYLMYSTDLGANFKTATEKHGYNSTHFQLEVDISVESLKKIADKYNCHHYFRARFGGPLFEIWVEEQFLVEFVSDEIRGMVKSI